MTLLIDLLLTIVSELIVASFFKVRRWDDRLLIIAMNMITNPAVHIVQWFFRERGFDLPLLWVVTFLTEIVVVIVEAKYLEKELDRTEDAAKMSICMNFVSFILGIPFLWMLLRIVYIG